MGEVDRRTRVLIVDDEVPLRRLMQTWVEGEGATALEAGSAEQALSLVESQGAPAVALCDVMLPGQDGLWLAGRLGLRPFELREESRILYHAGAAMASNYLVTLHRLASRLFERAGAPPEALLPLMRRTIDNGFELTGPIARGDWAIVDAHLAAIHEAAPDIEVVYRALAQVTTP